MKKIFFCCLALCTILFFGGLSNQEGNKVLIQEKDSRLPGWQWTSGEVEMGKTGAKQCFIVAFNPAIFHARDSIIITFSSYKVAITNLENGRTFGQWKGKVSLVYFINNNWIPLVDDTNDRINVPFSGKNNVAEDSLVNYDLRLTVPLSRTLTLTTSAISYEIDNDSSLPRLGAKGITLTTTISGMEVRKIEQR